MVQKIIKLSWMNLRNLVMSKKARRRPKWKKNNLSKILDGYRWIVIGDSIHFYDASIKLKDLYKDLYDEQEPLGEEFEKVLNDNLWDLYDE